MVNKYGRTRRDQEYRNIVASNIMNLRKSWDKWVALARVLSTYEKWAVGPNLYSQYLESLWKVRKAWNDVAKLLIENWNSKVVIKYIDKFDWLDKYVAKELMKVRDDEPGHYEYVGCEAVALNIDRFRWLDDEIASDLIDNWFWKWVVSKLESFAWLDYKIIVDKLIERWQWRLVTLYIDKFEWLDVDVAEKLIKAWYGEFVANNPERFWLKKEE